MLARIMAGRPLPALLSVALVEVMVMMVPMVRTASMVNRVNRVLLVLGDENGIVQIQCGEGKDATSTKLYKAF